VIQALKDALALVQNNTVFTLGQNKVFPGSLRCNGVVAANIKENIPSVCVAPKLV
jgi:hypothetical protein